MATHTRIPWKFPWAEEPGRLWSVGSVQGVTESDTTEPLTLSFFNFPVLATTYTDGNDDGTIIIRRKEKLE